MQTLRGFTAFASVLASAGNPTPWPVSPDCASRKGDEAEDLIRRVLMRPICDNVGYETPPAAKSLAVKGVDRLPVRWDGLTHMPQGPLQEHARGRIVLAKLLEVLSRGREIPRPPAAQSFGVRTQ